MSTDYNVPYVNARIPAPGKDRSSARTTIAGCVSLGETLLEALDRVGYGGLVVNAQGYARAINDAGRRMLARIMDRPAPPKAQEADWLHQSVRRLQNRATPWLPHDAEGWTTIANTGDSGSSERPLALYRVPLAEGDGDNQDILLILTDFSVVPHPNPATLRRIFGLTAAEARVAAQIGQGEMLADIAREQNVSVATVRSQLASVFAKTRTRRQTQLAMLLARVAILP